MMRWIAGLAVGALVAGCSHSESFVGEDPPVLDGAFAVGAPTRLTYSDGVDQVASFRADGTTLLYSFQPLKPLPPAVLARPDLDRCIGIMPAGGGTRREICRDEAAGINSTDAFEQASIGPDNAMLFAAYASEIGAPLVRSGTLRLGTVAVPYPGTVLLTTPANIGGFSFDHFGRIRWLSATSFLVQVHDQTLFGNPDNEAKSDTFALGVGILRGDLNGTAATFSAVAGTDSASGFDLSVGKDSIYFTRLDDARLYVVPVAGGTRRAVYTESAAARRILRDPVRTGNRIAVVAQNYQQRNTIKYPDPPLGLAPGSGVKLIGPGDGVGITLMTSSGVIRNQGSVAAFGTLAASPDGCRLVVEHRIVQQFTFTTDLYSYCLGNGGQCTCG